MTTVYPIHASNPPFTPTVKEEKRSIEEREAERRRRVVRRNSTNPETASPEDQWWSLEQVESFYRECCVGREEPPDEGISTAFLVRSAAYCVARGFAIFVHNPVGSCSVRRERDRER